MWFLGGFSIGFFFGVLIVAGFFLLFRRSPPKPTLSSLVREAEQQLKREQEIRATKEKEEKLRAKLLEAVNE